MIGMGEIGVGIEQFGKQDVMGLSVTVAVILQEMDHATYMTANIQPAEFGGLRVPGSRNSTPRAGVSEIPAFTDFHQMVLSSSR
jgi:hypothetical protein